MFSEQSSWIFALLHHQQCDSTRKPRQTPRHPTNRIPVDVGYLQRSAYKASFSLHTQTRDQSVQEHREERHCYKKKDFATNMVSSNEAHSQYCSVEEDPLARCPLSANLAILGAGTSGLGGAACTKVMQESTVWHCTEPQVPWPGGVRQPPEPL